MNYTGKINTAAQSKINWTSGIMALVGIAAAFDWIPPQAEEPIVTATMIFGPAAIATFRTWFTEKPL